MTSSSIRCRFAILAALAVSALLPAAQAHADGPNAVRTDAGCTTANLPANDDGSTDEIPLAALGVTADFFGYDVGSVYINNNGNITADSPQGEYTPFDFTTSGQVMIAPFLADVDTRAGSIVTYGPITVNGHQAACINWVDVGYYSQNTDKTNSFQLVLIDRSDTGSGNFDIEFNYDRVSWETGDASDGTNGFGGTSAAAGFTNGDGDLSHSFVFDGSFENGALLNGGPKALTAGTLNAGGQLGRYVFPVRNAAPTGATLTGMVLDPNTTPLEQAPVEVCQVGGSCTTRFTNGSGVYRAINLPAGDYNVTAHAPASGPEFADGHAGPITVSGTSTFNQDVTLGPAPNGLPPDTGITSHGQSDGGAPTVYWSEDLTLTRTGCANGDAIYQIKQGATVIRSGAMTESPAGSGNYSAVIPALYPNHGGATVNITIDCPTDPDDVVEFGIYIDPSGVVRNAGTGALIPGATVILFRSADADGPFIQVPDQSAIMSPGNRNNPDLTDGNGHFGWDVLAGFYKVRASADGCTQADTAVLEIPPPVTNLDIGLTCASGGGGGGGGSTTPGTTPTPKKCKKGQKLKKGKCVKKKKKKTKKRAASSALDALSAGGMLTVGGSEAK
ncbi:MAG: nidogen-like domain-containing protein [Solirubrobacterales bacterium]